MVLAQHSTSDDVTVQGWYSGSAHQTEVIQAGDGSRLLSTQVDGLIQAMASYAVQTGFTWDQGIEKRPEELQTVLAGYWQAHS